jgi:hypothetical protein
MQTRTAHCEGWAVMVGTVTIGPLLALLFVVAKLIASSRVSPAFMCRQTVYERRILSSAEWCLRVAWRMSSIVFSAADVCGAVFCLKGVDPEHNWRHEYEARFPAEIEPHKLPTEATKWRHSRAIV